MPHGAEPVYHRRAGPTQTVATALEQRRRGEIWGKEAQFGHGPSAKAHTGPLPPGVDGIEFIVTLAPDPGCPPGWALWRPPRVPTRWEAVTLYAVLGQVTITKLVDGGQSI